MAIIAIAFAVLVVYLISTLKSVNASLDEVKQTMGQLQQNLNGIQRRVDDISDETVQVLKNTNGITADIQAKIKSFDTLFASFKDVSESIHEVTSSARQVSATLSKSMVDNVESTVQQNKKRIAGVLEWGTVALHLYKKWRDMKQKETETNSDQKNIYLLKEGEDQHVK